jgi:hypothetical protein
MSAGVFVPFNQLNSIISIWWKKSRKIDTKYFAIEVDMEQKYHTNQIFSNKSQKAVSLSCNDNPIIQ